MQAYYTFVDGRERHFKVILILAVLTQSSRQFVGRKKKNTTILIIHTTTCEGNLFICGKRKEKKIIESNHIIKR